MTTTVPATNDFKIVIRNYEQVFFESDLRTAYCSMHACLRVIQIAERLR